jgi:hypothetical protein
MSKTFYRIQFFSLFLAIVSVSCISCNKFEAKDYSFLSTQAPLVKNKEEDFGNCFNFGVKSKALLSTRFKNLDHLKTIVSIRYDKDYLKLDSNECRNSSVNLYYVCNGEKVIRKMTSGVSQDNILRLRKADYLTRIRFVLANPNTIRQRRELENTYMLSRRRPAIFGPGDVSFYDLAEASFHRINTPDLAYHNARDSSEKGYINTFNHVTAQAIITSFFSEELADLIADLHERNNMPEITSGKFTQIQLNNLTNNPEDNYVDIINNEIGQKIGLKLKEKYRLNEKTVCTPVLLTAFLNDIQGYYMWALEIGLDNFRTTDEVVEKFSNKINTLLNRT